MSEPLLVLDRVAKRYGDTPAVRGIDLEIRAGEFVAIMGPSGCGKTTTLRMIAGLETPSEGEIRLDGQRLNDVKPWDRETPLVWQSLALFPFLSVLRNVEFGLKMRGVAAAARRARAMAWLERLGIGHYRDRKVDQLSGGELQRVALARALITEPKILLLDEPMSALDAHLVVHMQAELKQLQEQLGITFCYVTHNQSEAFAMADRVVIMSAGLILQTGTPRQVYRQPSLRFVAEFVGANNILPGVVREVRGGLARAETRFGTLAAALDPGAAVAPGASVDLVISADRVSLGTAEQPEFNNLAGTVIGEEFVGAFVTVHLDIGADAAFRVQIQSHALEALDAARGARLIATWRPEHTIILAAG